MRVLYSCYYCTGVLISAYRLLSACYVVGSYFIKRMRFLIELVSNQTRGEAARPSARVSQTTISNDGHSLATVSSRPASALTDAKCSLLGASRV